MDIINEEAKTPLEHFYFENNQGDHSKFWAIDIKANEPDNRNTNYSLIRRWGKIGTNGQTMIENYHSLYEAMDRKDKLICEKIAKGYSPII